MITKYLKEKKRSYDPYELSLTMTNDEGSSLKRTKYNLDYDIHVMPPATADAYIPNSKFQQVFIVFNFTDKYQILFIITLFLQGRLLMTHLGFLTFKNWGRIYPLEQSPNFFSQVKALDQVCSGCSFFLFKYLIFPFHSVART